MIKLRLIRQNTKITDLENLSERGFTNMAPRKKAAAVVNAEAAEVKEVKEVKAEAAVEAALAKKPARKTAAKKTPAKEEVKAEVKAEKVEAKAEAKAEVIIEYGAQVSVDEIVKNAQLTVGEDKQISKIYVKPEESMAYIVVGEDTVAMPVYFVTGE